MQLKEGTLLQNGEYKIIKVLGQGGFGITYLAEQTSLRRKVAIKEFFMKEYCNRDGDTSQVSVPSVGSKELVEKFREKFVKEAQNIASFSHNNIIKIYGVFMENNTAYYVMEYLDCGSLSDYLSDRGRLSEEESLTFIRQIADALSYIHKRKVNHLDVKPGNILLDQTHNAILIDFGLSKHYDERGGQTSSTPVCISHGYAPLEQYKQGGVSTFSPSTDTYSLGATLYKLLTGTTPPEADDVNENGLSFPANVHISGSMKKAIAYAMQPKRKDRPQSIEEFLNVFDKSERSQKSGPSEALSKRPKTSLDELTDIEITVPADNKINGHEYVDLGLPSGIKWATCNVGANRPEEYGDYFAWGEIKPKQEYTEGTYEHIKRGFLGIKKYVDLGEISGNAQYDVARFKWKGSWRLPTIEELEELKKNCTWSWTTQDGKKGYKVTGPNGNSIFLPAAGYRYWASLDDAGEAGYYWSSSPYGSGTSSAYLLSFNISDQYVDWYRRRFGHGVRPVSE